MKRKKTKQKDQDKLQVFIKVRGGVAYVTQCPDEVDVTIIDYDNEGR